MSDTMNSATPQALIRELAYHIRCPAIRPSTRLMSVTTSAEIGVGSSALATRQPTGRKNQRSAHSSTAGPLLEYTRGRLFEHGLYRDARFPSLFYIDARCTI